YITGNEYVRRFNNALGKQTTSSPVQIAPSASEQTAPNNDASLSGILSSPTTTQLAQQFGTGQGMLNVAPPTAPSPLAPLSLPGLTPVARALRQRLLMPSLSRLV